MDTEHREALILGFSEIESRARIARVLARRVVQAGDKAHIDTEREPCLGCQLADAINRLDTAMAAVYEFVAGLQDDDGRLRF